MTFVAVDPPRHLSFSQRNTFNRCGEQYRLSRVYRVPERPAWALLGGSAVHHATERFDLRSHGYDLPELTFDAALDQQIAEAEKKSGLDKADFRCSGRASKDWPNKENEEWWRFNGPTMVRRWEAFTRSAPWDLAMLTIDGVELPAVEVELRIAAGSAEIVAFIDRVMRRRSDGALGVVDLKSGASDPDSPDQLGLYKVGLEQLLGEPVKWGAFWSARSGSSSEVYDLAAFTHERIEYEYESFRYVRDAGVFMPAPSRMCSSCFVRDFCYVQNGERANEVPLPWQHLAEEDV